MLPYKKIEKLKFDIKVFYLLIYIKIHVFIIDMNGKQWERSSE